jgi:predicted metal-binding membrane protein
VIEGTGRVGWVGTAVLLAAAGAWAVVISQASGMQSAAGTMGLGLAGFLLFWVVMMAAMMLPSVTWVASAYATLPGRSSPAARAGGLLTGYLLAWAAVGLAAYLAARLAGGLAGDHGTLLERTGAAVVAGAGLYQLSPLKHRCLRHCRSPVGALVRANGSRALGHVRAGAVHGAYCVGCCAGLMVALVALGMMSLGWMAALAATVALEKNWRHGRRAALAAAGVLVAVGLAALVDPSLVPGFRAAPMGGM